MKITYDPRLDMLRILFRNAPISETSRQTTNVTLDYDHQGRLVGLELAAASEHIADLHNVHVVSEGQETTLLDRAGRAAGDKR
jgi:YD repeat-containing protein